MTVRGRARSYGWLVRRAAHAARLLEAAGLGGPASRLGVFTTRTEGSYIGVLAAGWAGSAYVPLDPAWPDARLLEVVHDAALTGLLLDDESERRLLAPSLGAVRRLPRIPVGSGAGAPPAGPLAPPAPRGPEAPAYLIYTSGSSGPPKAVVVTARNLTSFLRAARRVITLGPQDRTSQFFPLTFDLSVSDMFAAWGAGASVHVVAPEQRLAPIEFIRRHRLSVWFCTPSAAALLREMGLLRPGLLPTLRLSLFCGEPLPESLARDWSRAAPASRVLNLYGPTETTVACFSRAWKARSAGEGWVPIGRPFPGMRAAVGGRAGRVRRAGELWLSGPQVSPGYWRRPELTARAFVRRRGMVWYKTGDIVTRDGGSFRFHGRRDDMVKLLGHRVELGEVETALRAAAGLMSAAVAPRGPDGLTREIVAFYQGDAARRARILERLRSALPAHAVPRRLIALSALPVTAQGKIDRMALRRIAEAG